jgi:hypothetical protein
MHHAIAQWRSWHPQLVTHQKLCHVLQAVADAGNGTYYFIESPTSIADAFTDALGGLLSVCAQRVELRITPRHGTKISHVHTGLAQVCTLIEFLHYLCV